eukprot:3226263-Amphidinium_carterae.2
MSMTPTGIDQIVNALNLLGIDAAEVSLNDAQQLVATANTIPVPLPAASSQGLQTTIATLPETPYATTIDQDVLPLTMLQPTMDDESTETARILATAMSVATPLPAPPTIPLTT